MFQRHLVTYLKEGIYLIDPNLYQWRFMFLKAYLSAQKKSKPKFLGRKGSAVYQQEFFSFCNIKSAGRDHNWSQKFKVLCEELEKNNPELLASLKIKYQHLDPKIR